MEGRVGTLPFAVLALAAAVVLIAPPPWQAGIAQAHGHRCKHAHQGPKKVSRAKARRATVCVINKRRRAHGLRPLRLKRPLNRAASRHSRYMKRHACFAHQCPGEGDLVQRVARTSWLPCGCRWRLGEDIAWGRRATASPHATVRAWMHSPPHRQVLLDGGLTQAGVGVMWGAPGRARARAGIYTLDAGEKR